MLVAICGSQGSGKSTVLKELEKLGQNVVTRKTSRSILSDWNVTLEEVNNDRELTLKFQEEITRRKLHDELEYINSPELWFTERTHTDLFVYALVSLGKDNTNSDWIDRYYNVCKANNVGYLATFLLESDVFKVESDGVRGANQHYSTQVSLLMEHYQNRMECEETNQLQYIRDTTPEGRAFEVLGKTYKQLQNIKQRNSVES